MYSGYIPLDVTGDFLYQAFDGLSLAMALWLTRRVVKAQRESQEEHEDGLPIVPFAAVCVALACILHADLDDRPVFDSLWMNSEFTHTIALAPQLWMMMTRRTGGLSALTGHSVAVMGLSHILVGVYMWHGYYEITCEPWVGDYSHAAPSIMGTHAVHLMFLSAFAYAYVKKSGKSDVDSGFIVVGSTHTNSVSTNNQVGTLSTYAVFLAVAGFVYFKIAEQEFSSILTIAAIFQCLAFFLLGVQVVTGGVSGISAKMLQLQAVALTSRLCATTMYSGYIPLDVTGDFLYQAFDGLSLAMALWLIRRVLKVQRELPEEHE